MQRKTLLISTLFAISMGFFECAVVIYLRAIAYPNGFTFPLQSFNDTLALTEFIREIFSILMLLSVAFLISKKTMERFAWFIYNFAIWDLFYYLFLKLLLNWPESIFTFDILFLIPIIWVGPVIAPVLLSVFMIVLALIILHFRSQKKKVFFRPAEIGLLILGSLILILSFTLDYLLFFQTQNGGMIHLLSIEKQNISVANYIPYKFYWDIFMIGCLTILTGIIFFYKRNKKELH